MRTNQLIGIIELPVDKAPIKKKILALDNHLETEESLPFKIDDLRNEEIELRFENYTLAR